MVELYINGKLVELTNDIDFNFTYQSIDESNLSNTKNSFSKQVKIKGTPNNNIIFNHFFRNETFVDVSTNAGGLIYNPNNKVPFMIMQNGKLIEEGFCVLDSISRNMQDITYNFTLYGSIGNFFYNLTFKDNGERMKLSDLYFNWAKCTTQFPNSNYLSKAEEATMPLYKVDAATIAASWARINPLKDTRQTQISDDVVFIPAYCGLNDNFNSKKMLVNCYNGNYISLSGLTYENLQKFQSTFPINKTIDGVEYKAIGSDYMNSGDRYYGIVELPRDIDPWEANELRSTEMPIAIRVSKLIETMCNSDNTNVDVIIDDDIKNSPYYKYGWVLLGKLSYDEYFNNINPYVTNLSIPESYNDINTVLNKKFNGNYEVSGNNLVYDIEIDNSKIAIGKNIINLIYDPYIRVEAYRGTYVIGNFSDIIYKRLLDQNKNKIFVTGSFDYMSNTTKQMKNCWNTETVITLFKEGNTVIDAKVDLFYFDESTALENTFNERYNHGYGKYYLNQFFNGNQIESVEDVKKYVLDALSNWINQIYGLGNMIDRNDITIHDLEPKQNIVMDDLGLLDYVEYFSDEQNLTYYVNVNNAENFSITQVKLAMKTNLDLTLVDNVVEKSVSFSVYSNAYGSPYQEPFFNFWNLNRYGGTERTFNGYWTIADNYESYGYVNFKQSVDTNSTIYSINSESIITPILTKNELFSSTVSPSEYLLNFAKVLNLRFDYDFETNKLYIVPIDKYYKNETIVLDNDVDLSRSINIKPLSEYSVVDIKQETPDIYANHLYKQIEKEIGFADEKFITENKTTSSVCNLLEKTSSKNVIDWRLSSFFFNDNPQLPSVYNLNIINWTLSNVTFGPEVSIKQAATTTNGLDMTVFNSLNNITDSYKKICLFDKSDKYVDDVSNSFIFLNGFTKNYGYVSNGDNYILYPKLMITNDAAEQWTIAKGRCYMYSFKYTDYFSNYGITDFDLELYASPYYVPVFSRSLSNLYNSETYSWYDSESIVASWNIAKPKVESYVDRVNNTVFVKNTSVLPDKIINDEVPTENEYYVENLVANDDIYIYKDKWERFLGEMYGPNNRNITLYAKIYDCPRDALKKIYKYDGCLWIITKIENYNIDRTKDNFSKITLHRIEDKTVFVQ